MSYDLFFYKHNSNKITEQDFADYLTENLPFNASDIPKQWDYYNKENRGKFFNRLEINLIMKRRVLNYLIVLRILQI